MKYMSCSKTLLAVVSVIFAVPLVHPQPEQASIVTPAIVMAKTGKKAANVPFTSDPELNKVLTTINKEVKKEVKSDKDVYCLSYTYKKYNNQPISSSTKIYHNSYRKKPSRLKDKTFLKNINPTELVEVVYKPMYQHVTVITKDPSRPNQKLSSKQVKLNRPLIEKLAKPELV